MMDYLSSMYIDNEMNLDEKWQFVEKVRSDRSFYVQTLELLKQEQELRKMPEMPAMATATPWRPPFRAVLVHLLKPLGVAAAGFTAAVLLLFSGFQNPSPTVCRNRFILYEPSAQQVELAGSFTGWQRLSMRPVGNSGYWELNLPIPSGEYRFAYILDGDRQMADPTLPTSEKDDFGGVNSILTVENRV